MRSDLFVVLCVASGFLRSGNVCSAAYIYLSASDSTDGRFSWKGWLSSSPVWIIEAPPGQKVLLSFDELQIGYSRYSCDAYLEVRDGQYSSSSLLVKQCYTSTPPSPVYSSGRWLYVKFSFRYGSSSYNRVSGMYRALPDSSAKCPKVLLGNNTGVIYSPGFPNNYPPNENCYWTISAPWSYSYLLLNFTVLKLEYSSDYDCYDYVMVRDGEYSWSRQLAKYCKSSYSPVVLVPSGRDARVEFKSDVSDSAKGFLLFIRFTNYRYTTTVAPPVTWPTPTPSISSTVYLSASASTDGRLSSWNGWASSSTTWIIEAPPGQKVLLSCDELRVGYSGYSCGAYLEVRDGQYSWSSLLTKQCDTSTPPSPVYSSGRWLYVKFNAYYGSSSYDKVTAVYRALLVFSAECPKVLLGNNTGVIYSPKFPNNYPPNENCYWTISAPPYKYLLLNFTVLELEDSDDVDCYDYVIVRDGEYSWSRQLAKYCKSSYSPVVLVPSSRDARVEFKSDVSDIAKGFLLFIRFTAYRYTTTAAPPVTPYIYSTQRGLAVVLPLVVGCILMFVIIAVVVCEKRKRQGTPPPLGPAPPVVELQTFPQQVPVPTQPPQQPVAQVANSSPRFADESRAELAGQAGRDLHPPNDADWVTFSDEPPTESRDPAAQQPNPAQGENYYAPPLV